METPIGIIGSDGDSSCRDNKVARVCKDLHSQSGHLA